MPALLERPTPVREEGQPRLFSAIHETPERAARPAPARLRQPLVRRSEPVARATRLFSLEQRRHLRGVHRRRASPVGRMTYVAGVASPNPHAGISRWAHEPSIVTVTIGEMDLGASRPALRIVQHLRWAAEQGDRMDAEIHRTLLGLWRCRRVVVGAPENGPTPAHPPVMPNPPPGVVVTPMGRAARSRMGIGLLETIAARRVKAYVDDGSPESREFWAQIVKAQSRVSRDGTLDFDVDASPGGDGLLLSLALAVEAAHELFQPTQGRLHESIPA